MQILKKLKSIFGRDRGAQTDGQRNKTGVTVEREPDGSIDRSPPVSASSSAQEEPSVEPTTSDVEESETEELVEESDPEQAPTEPTSPTSEASETDESKEEVEVDETADNEPSDPVESISGIGPSYADRLGQAGVESVSDLLTANLSELAAETDISEKRLQSWVDQVEEN